jgi:hypothetical protein
MARHFPARHHRITGVAQQLVQRARVDRSAGQDTGVVILDRDVCHHLVDARNELPASFAVPAGIGDILVGLAAPFVAVLAVSGPSGARRIVIGWCVVHSSCRSASCYTSSCFAGLTRSAGFPRTSPVQREFADAPALARRK